ncbi:hypothetical protein GCM10028808_56680 [Spirosoma migulaei]
MLAVVSSIAMAQEKPSTGTTPFSLRPIPEIDIMLKKTLWRRIDLREKQNQPMFSKNNEISKYLVEAVKAGLLEAYTNDSCTTKLTAKQFHDNLLMPNTAGGLSAEEKAAGFAEEGKSGAAADGWDRPAKEDKKLAADTGWGIPRKKVPTVKPIKGKKGKTANPEVEKPKQDTVGVATNTLTGDEYFPKELNLLELKEDWIFDRKRSRLYHDIQTVTLLLPADKNQAGFEKPIATFKYKDLDRLFRSDPRKFIWYNVKNQAQHKNLADAFDLRLFYGRITKVANPDDLDLVGLYGDRGGLLKSYQLEYELMETEHNLWEF